MQGDSPTTETTDIGQAVATGSPERIDDAVGQLIARLRRGGDATEVLAACALLQSERRFAALLKLADSAARIAKPDDAWQLWPYVLAGLTELDAMLTAERLVTSLLTEPESAVKRGEFLGRLGRIKKDQFVESGDPAALQAAIHAYVEAYATGNDPLWTGVNAIALRALAARRKLPADGGPAISLDDLLTLAATAPSPRGAWSITTELELRVARGEKAADLQPLLTQLFAAADATGFVYASFARQLNEIWEMDASDPLMVMLGEKTLVSGQGEVMLPTTAADYESLFGAETPIGIENYLKGAGCACAVGALLHPSRGLRGTVFAVEGANLHASLAGRVVLITNEHVVPDPEHHDAPGADELTAHFVAAKIGPNEALSELSFGALRTIWQSPREKLDVSLMISDDPAVAQLSGLAPPEPGKLPEVFPGAFVYVIGHPSGGDLALSIRGNDLIEIADDNIRIHYKAPTQPGSSGSPVFNESWELIGVHHMGAPTCPPGNEGIALQAIRAELAARPPKL